MAWEGRVGYRQQVGGGQGCLSWVVASTLTLQSDSQCHTILPPDYISHQESVPPKCSRTANVTPPQSVAHIDLTLQRVTPADYPTKTDVIFSFFLSFVLSFFIHFMISSSLQITSMVARRWREEALTDAIVRSGRQSIKTCSADCQKSSQSISAEYDKNRRN